MALADASYAALAAVGVSAALQLLSGQRCWFELAGGVALVAVGLAGLRRRPSLEGRLGTTPAGLLAALASIYGLTIANPATIISFAALFAGPAQGLAGGSPVLLVLGVLLGSAAWWALLAGLVSRLRARLDQRVLRVLQLASGLAISAFGVAALVVALRS